MAKCEFCGKDLAFGIKVSHSHRRSNRTWKLTAPRGMCMRAPAASAAARSPVRKCHPVSPADVE